MSNAFKRWSIIGGVDYSRIVAKTSCHFPRLKELIYAALLKAIREGRIQATQEL
jgi:hypothetical protein